MGWVNGVLNKTSQEVSPSDAIVVYNGRYIEASNQTLVNSTFASTVPNKDLKNQRSTTTWKRAKKPKIAAPKDAVQRDQSSSNGDFKAKGAENSEPISKVQKTDEISGDSSRTFDEIVKLMLPLVFEKDVSKICAATKMIQEGKKIYDSIVSGKWGTKRASKKQVCHLCGICSF